MPVSAFMEKITEELPARTSGTAVYMASQPEGTPPALLQNLEHDGVLHERVVFLTLITHEVPYVDDRERFEMDEHGEGVDRVTADVGFTEDPNVPERLFALMYHNAERARRYFHIPSDQVVEIGITVNL